MDRRRPNRVRGLPATHLLPAYAQRNGVALAMLTNDHSGAAVVARGGTTRVQYLLCVCGGTRNRVRQSGPAVLTQYTRCVGQNRRAEIGHADEVPHAHLCVVAKGLGEQPTDAVSNHLPLSSTEELHGCPTHAHSRVAM
jgi:hypothetical protein